MDFLVVITALAGLVWLTWFALRGSLVAGCLVVLLSAACFGYPFLHFDLGPLPLTLDRLAVGLLVGCYLVQRGLGLTDPKPMRWFDWTLLAFLALVSISTFTHNWHADAPGKVSPVWQLIVGYLFPVAIYWVARQLPLTERSIHMVLGSLTVFGGYLAITGILEAAEQWSLVFPSYIADPEVGLHFGRARGPMVQSVSYGLYLGVCLIAALAWLPRLNRVGQLVVLLQVPLMLAAVYFSYTRSVWMGTGLALFVALAFWLRGNWRPLVLGPMVAAALIVGGPNLDRLAGIQRSDAAGEGRESAGMRGSFAYVSWKMFLDHPLWGVGFGQFQQESQAYLSDRETALRLEQIRGYINHNTLLSLLTDTGLIGLGLFLAVVYGWIQCGWRLARDASLPQWQQAYGVLLLSALSTYFVQMMFHEVSYTMLDNGLVFTFAGIAVGLRSSDWALQCPVQTARCSIR